MACDERAPHKVTTWVRELAGRFHGFYHDCYVIGEGVSAELTQARLWLVEAARVGLAIGLDLLGVSRARVDVSSSMDGAVRACRFASCSCPTRVVDGRRAG